MVHSVELVFDADTAAVVRQIWSDLRDAGIPSQAPASRPHATLTVAERIDPAVDALLARLGDRFPFPCRIGAPLLFGRAKVVLARLVVPTIALLEMHDEVSRMCLPHLQPGPLSNARARSVDRARHPGPARWCLPSWAARCGSRASRPRSSAQLPDCAAGTAIPSASTRSPDVGVQIRRARPKSPGFP